MTNLEEMADDFLAQRRIAVAGVSRESGQVANAIYRKLRGAGYEVFALNPAADQVEGDRCWSGIGDLPRGPDGVVIATPPDAARQIVEEAARAGVKRVWFHRSFGEGSVDPEAVGRAREEGMKVIAGACPMMFLEPVDLPHRCIRWFLGATGKLPGPPVA